MSTAVVIGISFLTPHAPLRSACALATALGFSTEGWFGVSVIAFAEIGGEGHSGGGLGVALT